MAPTPDLAGRTVWVIDTLSRIYQLFHALPEMTSPRGEPVSAVYGFARDLLEILTVRKPDYVFSAMDAAGPTFRHEAFEDYKANRPEMPGDLVPQIPLVRRLLEVMGIPLVEQAGYEADDILATIAARTAEAGGHCMLATSDKDARQLLGKQVDLFNLRTGKPYGVEELREEWGIGPEQVVDFLSLVGDSVDNVPGVPLIGPKIASELLGRFGSLDGVLDHAGEVSGKKRSENLRLHADTARASRPLVQLHADVPVEIPWTAAAWKLPDAEGVAGFLREMGFKSLVAQATGSLAVTGRPAAERGLFDDEPEGRPLRRADDEPAAEAFVAALIAAKRAAVCVAATQAPATDPGQPTISGMAVALPEETWWLPAATLASERAADGIGERLCDGSLTIHAHDLKRQRRLLEPLGLTLSVAGFDTMLAAYLLDAGQRSYMLADVAAGQGIALSLPEPDDAVTTPEGAAAVARGVLELAGPLAESLEHDGLGPLFREVEMPLVAVLAGMESAGVRVDIAALERLSATYAKRLAALDEAIEGLAGHPFLIGSPQQVRKVLFEELGLPVIKRTKTGPSTDAEVLETLAEVHPLPRMLLEHRQFSKLKSTYVDSLPRLVSPRTGRIHASFNQMATATGRLSSSNPNLQNIPVRTREGREIRGAFLPREEGWRFVTADYSQIELRVLAHLSGDEAMRAAFAEGDDIHLRTAMAVFGVDRGGVTGQMRRTAKAVNFGILYGQSGFGLAKTLGITQLEAAAFIDRYFATFAGAASFIDDLLDRCRAERLVTTMLGRRRTIHGVRDREGRRNASGSFALTLPERTAVNTVVQGSAADLIKLAMLAVQRALAEAGLAGRLVLQIHDELLLESPAGETARLRVLVSEAMETAMQLEVPLVVSVHEGRTWDDCDKAAGGGGSGETAE